MKFLLDESAEFRLAAFLRELGHDVSAIAHDYPHALSDQEVLAIANSEQRILITNDRDFGELIFRLGLPHSGVILFRLGAASQEEKSMEFHRLLMEQIELLGSFVVVTKGRVRVRHLA